MSDVLVPPMRLTPCPFCGGNELERDSFAPDRFGICCQKCSTIGPEGDTVEGGDAAWNRRVVDPNDAALVEAVARAIAPKAWDVFGKIGVDGLAHASRRTASLRHARAAIEAIAKFGGGK